MVNNNFMNTTTPNLLSSQQAAEFLTQVLGPKRFDQFTQEALEQLNEMRYMEWSVESMVDHITAEMNSTWHGKQPRIADFQKMVGESRSKCKEYKVELADSCARVTMMRVYNENDFDFAKINLQELLGFFSKKSSATTTPTLYLTITGKKLYTELDVTIILSGVYVVINFYRKTFNN